jgi:hypothetical protein
MNTIPYFYDQLWRDHQIDYYEFNNYKLIKDLSKFNNTIKIIILIFEKDNERFLFGFDDGILFPYLVNYNIYNFNLNNYRKNIKDILINIINEIKEYYSKEIKIFNYPYYQYNLGFNLFNFLDIKNNSYFDLINIINDDLLDGLKSNVKNIINKYNSKKIFNDDKINIYFGEINEDTYNLFINKHFELASKKTKSDKCWNILKQFILDKKAFLVNYKTEFVYFFISTEFSYYGINACTKKSDICTILIYEAYKFLKSKNCNFIYMYHYIQNTEDEKLLNLSFFKKSISNKIINNFYAII